MKKLNIHEAKSHFSAYAQRVKDGESLILCDRNVPFAEIRPLPRLRKGVKRPFGLYSGKIEFTEDPNQTDAGLEKEFQKSKIFPRG